MTALPGGLGLSRSISRRSGTASSTVDGGRIVADPGSGIRDPGDPDVRGSRQRRALAGPRQRAHPSRAVVAARSRAAGDAIHRLGEDAVRDSRRGPSGWHAGGAGRADSRRDSRSCARRAPWPSATSAIRSPRSSRCWQAGLDGVVFHELLGFKERDGALVEATRDAARRRRPRGARVSLAPHAPYSTSLELFSAIRAAVDEIALPDHERAPRRVGGRSRAAREGQRPVARHARDDRRVARRLGRFPACDPVQYLDRHGVIDARTLVVHGVQFDDAALDAAARARRDARDLPAQQSVGRRRLSADRAVLSSRACRSPSAPTAWPASTI